VTVDEIIQAVEALPAVPYYNDDDEYMCPNCVTPWKCNEPHIPDEREPGGHMVDRAAVLELLNR
jgi:hypothetical protein